MGGSPARAGLASGRKARGQRPRRGPGGGLGGGGKEGGGPEAWGGPGGRQGGERARGRGLPSSLMVDNRRCVGFAAPPLIWGRFSRGTIFRCHHGCCLSLRRRPGI